MTSTLYTIDTIEADDGTQQPNEALWSPAGKDAIDHGFVAHDGLLIAGIGYEDEEPDEFVTLGHGHTWTAIAAAADKWMDHCHPTVVPETYTRPPVEQHAVFIRHPHPDHPCGCEWEGQWRVVCVPSTEPGAIAVSIMSRPGGAR
ncbi:hypothetical protein [Streptomyces scopuliridis]|uniref:hypothetical protein n=1 Tax=Streptomyces scopuliridis TaxID=452529 RepID=UPI0035E3B662